MIAALAVLVLAAIALDTKVVKIGSDEDVASQVFSPETFGTDRISRRSRPSIDERAVDAKTLAAAIAADKAAAAKQYGVAAGIGSVIPVPSPASSVTESPASTTSRSTACPRRCEIRVQTGPAINGTDLRDATGEIQFGEFKNQIEYQNAGSGINNAMKKQVLAGVDTKSLTGKTISVVGAFTLVNPKNWLVTPVELKVQ